MFAYAQNIPILVGVQQNALSKDGFIVVKSKQNFSETWSK